MKEQILKALDLKEVIVKLNENLEKVEKAKK